MPRDTFLTTVVHVGYVDLWIIVPNRASCNDIQNIYIYIYTYARSPRSNHPVFFTKVRLTPIYILDMYQAFCSVKGVTLFDVVRTRWLAEALEHTSLSVEKFHVLRASYKKRFSRCLRRRCEKKKKNFRRFPNVSGKFSRASTDRLTFT